jgi:hypothetical protein
MPSHPLLLTASPLRKTPTQGDVPNPDSETGHGETVSVEDSPKIGKSWDVSA